MDEIKTRLEYLRQELRAERISYGELIELQGLAEHIEAGDTELLEYRLVYLKIKTMESKKERAVRLALDYAKEREDKGLLVVSGTDMDEMDWSGGDPETVYSIVSLYSDDENNMDDEWNEAIEAALMEKYPSYF